MDTEKFYALNSYEKVEHLLKTSENLIPYFSTKEYQSYATFCIEACWNWLKNKEKDGEYLYNLLDDESEGLVSIQYSAKLDKDNNIWSCIIDAVAYTSRKAYEAEETRYFPEPIALVEDSIIEHFNDCLNQVGGNML